TGKKAAATPRKKEQQPRPRSVQAVTTMPSVKSPEMANAIILYGKFDEKRFALALRNLKVASLLLTKYQTSTDSFVLLEKLIEEDKIKILLRLAANNIHILLNIPFNQLFKFIDKNKSDAHREAYNSFLKMSLIRTDMEKIKLEADMVKHYITYQENCPPLPSFKEEQASVVELCSYIKEESCTPAHLDIVGGDCKHLTTLHAMGADLNRTDVQGKTPTYWLSILGKTKELRLFKTWGGVDFEAGSHRLTPANGAARSGNVTVLKLLKEWGVQLDKPDQPTGCPIHTAAFHGDISLLKKFHAWGLKMDVLDADGNPPIYLATINEKYEVLKLFNNLGIKLDTLCKDGSTIVHGAADKGDLQALELFHQWKIPLNTLNALGNAPIHYAVRYVEILKAFKSWEENLDIQTENGATLMYAAADNGFLGTVKFLIKHNPHQAKIPALFPAKHFMESICTRYDDDGIQRRAFDKLNERSLAGDPDSSIQILPIDIAEIMGYSDIVAELTKLTPKETLTPRANFSPGFLKPEKKRSKEKVESKDESSNSTEKEEAQSAVNSSIATEGYLPTFFNSSTKSKDTNLPKTPVIPVVKRSI
ncbi:ankyrin repeat domain-containing protein, partial [Legionella sp.]